MKDSNFTDGPWHPRAGYVEFEMISFSGRKFARKTLSLIYPFSML